MAHITRLLYLVFLWVKAPSILEVINKMMVGLQFQKDKDKEERRKGGRGRGSLQW